MQSRNSAVACCTAADFWHLPEASAASVGQRCQDHEMSHGHHGANHPVQDLATGVVMITSQNHGFAVDADSLPDNPQCT